jgi:hypothetical protein
MFSSLVVLVATLDLGGDLVDWLNLETSSSACFRDFLLSES